ncbi:hypothetical protein ACJJTC_017051 [Scirpophaga incertulas]
MILRRFSRVGCPQIANNTIERCTCKGPQQNLRLQISNSKNKTKQKSGLDLLEYGVHKLRARGTVPLSLAEIDGDDRVGERPYRRFRVTPQGCHFRHYNAIVMKRAV